LITDGLHEHHEGVNGLPRGMKSYPKQFSRLPYYEHLLVVHLFDTMHIGKNVAETLWRILDGRSDKEKIVKICNDIHESNHAMKDIIEHLNNDGDQINIRSLPWLLTEQQSKAVKEVIQKIKFPTGFCSNMKNILTRKGDFGGVKTHDWHVFIKVIIFLVYILVYYNIACFWFTFLLNFEKYIDETCSLLQYVLPVSLPDNFDNNVKQVIYDLGKYMR
jgi:hypothetical protein